MLTLTFTINRQLMIGKKYQARIHKLSKNIKLKIAQKKILRRVFIKVGKVFQLYVLIYLRMKVFK
jgi:hypothetical protein